MLRPYKAIFGDGAEAKRVENGDGAGTHGENVAENAADASGGALERFDVAGMIVRFDLEGGDEAAADVHNAGVFARTLHDELAARGQALEVHLARLVGAMLAPHHGENSELGDIGLSAEDLLYARVFFRGQAMLCGDFCGDFDFGGCGCHLILPKEERARHAVPSQKRNLPPSWRRYLSCRRLREADQRFDHGTEYRQTIGGTQRRFDGALGMRHQAGDVALAIADAGDIVHRAVGIAGGIVFSVGGRVTEDDLPIFLKIGERGFIAGVVAVGMRDGDFEDLALLRSVSERRIRLLDADVDVAADEAQAGVAHHGAGKEPGFTQNLKTVADAQDRAATAREFFHRLHHGRKARNRAGAQVIAKGEAAREDDSVAIRKVFRLVPDEFNGLVQDVSESVKRVVVAIGPGKDDDSKFHAVVAPWNILGNSILAQCRVSLLPAKFLGTRSI